jgi:pyruvate dehydrogenase E1 component alpha subunit
MFPLPAIAPDPTNRHHPDFVMKLSDFDPLQGAQLQVLSPEGEARADLLPALDEPSLRLIYRRMFAARLADRRCIALQREGRMGTYPPVEGQEACQVGSALALAPTDWIVPSFRELAALLVREVPLPTILLYWMGSEAGSCLPKELRVLPVSIPVGSHTLHAAGMAMAIRYRKQPDAVICYFGDGATSEGDFHEALTFAGVAKAPVIFFCQNNGWAISVPRKQQCAAASLAAKGVGYGMPGIQIDGNDPFAAYLATTAALERARAGEGPTLIEAQTYRFGPHTTSDDPSRYRDAAEVERQRGLDPLLRYRRFLQQRGLWSEAWEAELTQEIDGWLEQAIAEAEAAPAPRPEELFASMFAELPPHLQAQRDELLAALKEG